MIAAANPTGVIPVLPATWQRPMQAGVLLFLMILSGLFILALPTRYTVLTEICYDEVCPVIWLTPDDVVALSQMDISIEFYAAYQTGIEVIAVAMCALLSGFIFYYHRHTWMGLLTATVVFATPIFVLNAVWTFTQVNQSLAIPIELIQDTAIIALFAFMHIFPNGRFTPRWTRWNLLLISVWQLVTFVNIGNPTEIYSREWYALGFGLLGLLGVVMLGSQIYRYRRVLNAVQKQQMKWVLFAFFITVLGTVDWVIFFELAPPVTGQGRILNYFLHLPLAITTQVAIPIAIAIAILQYRLWDVDILINRTLVYSILTFLIVVLYVFTVSTINLLFHAGDNTTISVVATGIIVLSVQQFRDWVQRGVNRLMFGQRNEPQAVLLDLSQRLQTAILPDDLLQISVETVGKALKLPYAAIIIRRGTEQVMQSSYGTDKTPTQSLTLVYQNEAVGELIVGQRSTNETLNDADMTLLESIAQQMGAVVYAVRLQSELQAARERLVITREEERRRLRRDLHDGLGPALASQPLKIDAAIDLIPQNEDAALDLLHNVKNQAQVLVGDIRRIIHDLRPPALDELGLIEALRSAISSLSHTPDAPQIQIESTTALPALPAAVEVAAYRITMEAVTNVFRHTQAKHCWINFEIQARFSQLQIIVKDDGIGLAQPITPGVGLQSMRERAEELGGTFQIENLSGSGTQIQVILPFQEVKKAHDG